MTLLLVIKAVEYKEVIVVIAVFCYIQSSFMPLPDEMEHMANKAYGFNFYNFFNSYNF